MKTNQNVQIIDGDFVRSQDLEDSLIENDGSLHLNQWVSLSIEGIQYDVDYILEATAQIFIDNGDRFNPPSVEVVVKNIDFRIETISSNEEILELNSDEKLAFQTILKKVI